MVRKRRKTVAEKQAEQETLERAAWEKFEAALSSANTLEAAVRIVYGAPPERSPGRRFYSNLGFLMLNLGSQAVPGSASIRELQLYQDLIARIASELGGLDVERLIASLRAAERDPHRRP